MNKKKILIIIFLLLSLFILDRYFWMPNRTKHSWLQESGRNLGDPISYQQDFILNDSEILFQGKKSTNEYPAIKENRNSKFYLAGCYLGNLYIYDLNRKEMIVYFDK